MVVFNAQAITTIRDAANINDSSLSSEHLPRHPSGMGSSCTLVPPPAHRTRNGTFSSGHLSMPTLSLSFVSADRNTICLYWRDVACYTSLVTVTTLC